LNIGGTAARRFPPPWDIEEYDRSSFIVRATTVRRWLTYISRQSPEGTAAKLLTRDEEIARNIANYFVFISRARVGVSGASEWMRPMKHGKQVDLVEIGANWYVDDLPPMMFIKKAPNSHGFVNPRQIEEMWRDEFDWVYREMDYGIFPITVHPDVSGRPQVLLMLERLVGHINAHSGVRWMTMEEIAEDFRRRQPFKGH